MTITPENRSVIIDDYVDAILDTMDSELVLELAATYLSKCKAEYTDEQLENEILEYYPHILDVYA